MNRKPSAFAIRGFVLIAALAAILASPVKGDATVATVRLTATDQVSSKSAPATIKQAQRCINGKCF